MPSAKERIKGCRGKVVEVEVYRVDDTKQENDEADNCGSTTAVKGVLDSAIIGSSKKENDSIKVDGKCYSMNKIYYGNSSEKGEMVTLILCDGEVIHNSYAQVPEKVGHALSLPE